MLLCLIPNNGREMCQKDEREEGVYVGWDHGDEKGVNSACVYEDEATTITTTVTTNHFFSPTKFSYKLLSNTFSRKESSWWMRRRSRRGRGKFSVVDNNGDSNNWCTVRFVYMNIYMILVCFCSYTLVVVLVSCMSAAPFASRWQSQSVVQERTDNNKQFDLLSRRIKMQKSIL